MILTCFFGLTAFWLFVSVLSLAKKNKALHRQLTVSEFNLRQTKTLLYQSEKKIVKNQERQEINLPQENDLNVLKQENDQLKEKIKNLTDELYLKQNEYKNLETLHIDKVYKITNERDHLMSQIRETKSNISKVITLQSKLQIAEQEILRLTQKNSEQPQCPND